MKLQICAEIEGLFLIKEPIVAKLYPYEFDIFCNNGKYFISITKPVKNYEEYVPKMFRKDGVTTIVATNPKIYKDLIDWLYYIESMGAFNFEVSKIHFEELEVKWIYETEEEKGTIAIPSLKRNKEKQKAEKYITNKNLSNIVVFRRMLPEAHIPFSYYRQAHIFFNDGNYYFAYINYFMMLEFCFADGHFHKQAVTNNFCKSELLKLCVLSTLNMLKNDKKADNYKWLYEEGKSRQKKVDFEGVVYILIEYRGLLSHATERSKKYLFDNNKLRPIALIISIICFLLCGYMQIFCCSSEESKKRLIKENIDNLEKVKKDEI